MENNRHCQSYMPLLLKIGQLAFSTLFNAIREESLLFDKRQVKKYLSKEELKQSLAMGMLSEVKDTTSLSEERLQLHFPHKTHQEFFCALFIVKNWDNAKTGTISIKQTISNKCTSVSDIVVMSEVFVFLCGLNPEVYLDISRHLATIVSKDQSVIDYRNGEDEDSLLLKDYQRMQISCFLESTRNQHTECKVVIEDVLVSRGSFYHCLEKNDERALDKILSNSECSPKSLNIKHLPSAGWIVRLLEQTECPCLESLSVESCELTLCQSVLTTAPHTLKYLKLKEVSLTDDMWSTISRLNNLQGLNLYRVNVSSESLNAVSDCISSCMSLQKLGLNVSYKPSGTEEKREHREASYNYLLRSFEAKTMLTYLGLYVGVCHQNYALDLSRHDKLLELGLYLPLSLHINTEQLVKCNVCAPVVSSLLAELYGAPVLETLTLRDIRNPPPRIDITSLPRLTEFTLAFCDLRGSTVTVSPELTSLETITLDETTVNIPCWRELFLSISKLPQPITVKLEGIKMIVGEWRELIFDILGKLPKIIHVEMKECKGRSEKEWRKIVDDMKASQTFRVLHTVLIYSMAGISFDTVVV